MFIFTKYKQFEYVSINSDDESTKRIYISKKQTHHIKQNSKYIYISVLVTTYV